MIKYDGGKLSAEQMRYHMNRHIIELKIKNLKLTQQLLDTKKLALAFQKFIMVIQDDINNEEFVKKIYSFTSAILDDFEPKEPKN